MKKTAIVLTALTLLLIPAWGRAAAAGAPQALEDKIAKGVSLLMDDNTDDHIDKGMVLLVESVDAAATGKTFSESFLSKIRGALQIFREQGARQEMGIENLRAAYALLNDGKPFQMPAGLKDVAEIGELCRKKADIALVRIKAGTKAEAVKPLLELILLVVTPVITGQQ